MTDFNVKRVSPSRVGKYAECGLAFKFSYIDQIPSPARGSAALFGSVMHKARETWILDRTQDFVKLTEVAWRQETTDDPTISAFISAYQSLSRRAMILEDEIRARRPELVAVRRSKDWKQSTIYGETGRLMSKWRPKLEQSRYRFTDNDPLPALYDESLLLAAKYAAKWRHLPNALYSEFGFEFEWEGYTLTGRIDEIGLLIDKDTGEMQGYSVEDAKTYRNAPHAFRDSRQLAIYDLAIINGVNAGILELDLEQYPVYPALDLMRLLEKWHFAPVRSIEHRRLLSDLQMYEAGVANRVFLPAAKSCRADFCDYASDCAFYHGNQSTLVDLNVA